MDFFPIYVALWRRAQAEVVWVHYDGALMRRFGMVG